MALSIRVTLTTLALIAAVTTESSFALPVSTTNGSSTWLVQRLLPSHLQLDLQELSNLAMNPSLSNQSLLELYRESAEIINGTDGADSVLLELEPVDVNSTEPRILVLAVLNPDAPTHDDLLEQFSLYFVNLNNTLPFGSGINTASFNMTANLELLQQTGASLWTILRNFVKNQVNAFVGALWSPLSVGAKAMQQQSLTHAQYVEAGTTFASAISQPIIMKAISMPNRIATHVVNVTTTKVSAVESAEFGSKQVADSVVDHLADNVEKGGRLAVKYIARPIGAFVGARVVTAGQAVTRFGQNLHGAALQLSLLGQQLHSSAVPVVAGGSWALAWGMDQDVVLPSDQH